MSPYPPHVAVGKAPDVLSRILEPGINLAIWERTMDLCLEESVRAVAAQSRANRWLPRAAEESWPAETAWDRFTGCLPWELTGDDAAAVVADFRDNVRLFRSVVAPERLTLSWRSERGIPTEDWHVDPLRFRLICCYDRSTTRWLSNGDAVVSLSNPLSYRKRWFSRRRSLPLGGVCVFKGLHPVHACDPLVHTEPPGTGIRLVSVITD